MNDNGEPEMSVVYFHSLNPTDNKTTWPIPNPWTTLRWTLQTAADLKNRQETQPEAVRRVGLCEMWNKVDSNADRALSRERS